MSQWLWGDGAVRRQGASLHYNVAGMRGPTVLLIQGGLDEGEATRPLVEILAREFHVVTYDRRGLGRSIEHESAETGERLALHAADAAAILRATTPAGSTAHVVSACIGALIGLHLTMTAPELVASLSAHEPPVETLVSNAERSTIHDEIGATAGRGELFAAIGQLARLTGSEDPTEDDLPARPKRKGNLQADLGTFFSRDFSAVRRYRPDYSILSAVKRPIQLTGGTVSRGRWEYQCAYRIASEIGGHFDEIAGGHNPLVTFPRASATMVRRWVGG